MATFQASGADTTEPLQDTLGLLPKAEALPDDDSLPPMAPDGAYPAATANPLSATKYMAQQRERKEHYTLYIRSNTNNNIYTFTRPDGGPVKTLSSGQFNYRHKNRSTPEAAHAVAVAMFKVIEEEHLKVGHGRMTIEVKFNGFGKGREAVQKALLAGDGANVREMISRLTDITPIKIGGPRAKKARRM